MNQQSKSSKYMCVSWNQRDQKWKGMFRKDGADHYCGKFETEIEAARAVNKRCREIGIPIKNNISDSIPNTVKN